jgi:ATP-dependent exoDNAse (exonuclease V) beta subunit
LISRDVDPGIVAAGERRYMAWSATRDTALAAGKAPSLQVRSTTEWAAAQMTTHKSQITNARVDVIALDADPGRPSGARFGTLVHASLASCPLDATAETVAQVVRTQARIVAATGIEADAAIAVVRRAFADPLFDRARRAEREGRCLRETPVTLTVDGVLIEGVVDFAFETDAGYEVIDFKTDRASGELLARYQRQVGLYANAIARATGRPARAVLMKV